MTARDYFDGLEVKIPFMVTIPLIFITSSVIIAALTPAKVSDVETHPSAAAKPPHFLELEQHLHSRFGTPVVVRAKSADRGQIIINYSTQEEFDRVSSLIRG